MRWQSFAPTPLWEERSDREPPFPDSILGCSIEVRLQPLAFPSRHGLAGLWQGFGTALARVGAAQKARIHWSVTVSRVFTPRRVGGVLQ
ncbi:hypothetical protein SBV1_1260002 [Verrucomicrobia bacterium]|nr:hypothetical protein SBV1_1260002 [Verrucomicrobiota bacterium]